MIVLLDTNVVSELIRKAPDPAVEAWAASHPLEILFFSAVGGSGVALRRRHLADGPTPRNARLGYREDAARCFQEPGVALRQGGGAAHMRTSQPRAVPPVAPSRQRTARSRQSPAPVTWRWRRATFGISRTSTSSSSIPGRRHERYELGLPHPLSPGC